MYVVDDSTFLYVFPVLPNRQLDSLPGDWPRKHLALVDRRTGERRKETLSPPEIGQLNLSPALNNVAACVHPHSTHPLIVALNAWTFEALTLSATDLTPIDDMNTAVEWIGPVSDPLNPAGRVPATGILSASCAESFVVLWHAGRMAQKGPLKFPFAHFEIRDYSGTLRLASNLREIDGTVLDRVLAVSDQWILVRGTTSGGIPVVVEFAIALDQPTRSAGQR